MPAVRAVADVFDRLSDQGRSVSVWWRDDDAVRPTPQLDRLLAITGRASIPVALATVPARAESALAERLAGEDGVAVLVHGWAHANHAPPDEKPSEFGSHRDADTMMGDAGRGLDRARAVFGEGVLPVFVPPWNRIHPEAARGLGALGYEALSCFGQTHVFGPGLPRLDTHLDPVAWRADRRLLPPDAVSRGLRRALDDGAEQVGVLTHHLDFDDDLFGFASELAGLLTGHPAVRVASAGQLLAEVEGSPALAGAPA